MTSGRRNAMRSAPCTVRAPIPLTSVSRLQDSYHQLPRKQRDTQKSGNMLPFAHVLPALRAAARRDLRVRG
jgi:hypothetical protein